MIGNMMRRRLVLYVQVVFLCLVAIYLLFRYEQYSRQSKLESLGVSGYSDQWPVDDSSHTELGRPAATEGSLPSYDARISSAPVAQSNRPTKPATSQVPAETTLVASNDEEDVDGDESGGSKTSDDKSSEPSPTPVEPPKLTKEERREKARKLVPSILDPNNTSIDRMSCPAINETRYEHLKVSKWERKHKYLIAINLRQCFDLLPRLLGSVLEVIHFLGPQQVALSIVEGNSDDGTQEVLELLRSDLDALGVAYFLRNSELNPSEGGRIEKLGALRAQVVAPLTANKSAPAPREDEADASGSASSPDLKNRDPEVDWAEDTTVLFLNDVAACAEDVLELAHQRVIQKADMTCAMDWVHVPQPLFYDVWVSRAINGDSFFSIPNGSWDRAKDLFPNEPIARHRLQAHRPFQVFSCWNGAVVFTAAPLLRGLVEFRAPKAQECFQGEVQLFCKDLWFNGYGRIAVVPSVNLEYTDEKGRKTKEEKGYTSEWVICEHEEVPPPLIDWQEKPPDMVKCMPTWTEQSWLPWNESLV